MDNCQTKKATVADDHHDNGGGGLSLDVKVSTEISSIPSSISDDFKIPIKTFTPTSECYLSMQRGVGDVM